MLAGVAGGLGRYFGIDPVIVRIAFVVLTFFGGAGVAALPRRDPARPRRRRGPGGAAAPAPPARAGRAQPRARDPRRRPARPRRRAAAARPALFAGGIIVPLAFLVLLGLGVAWLVTGRRPERDAGLDRRAPRCSASASLLLLGVLSVGAFWAAGPRRRRRRRRRSSSPPASRCSSRRSSGPRAGSSSRRSAIAIPAAFVAGGGHRPRRRHRRAHLPPGDAPTQIREHYEVGAGRLVDRPAPAPTCPPATATLDIDVGMGEAVLIVPDDVCVATDARVGMGATVGVRARRTAASTSTVSERRRRARRHGAPARRRRHRPRPPRRPQDRPRRDDWERLRATRDDRRPASTGRRQRHRPGEQRRLCGVAPTSPRSSPGIALIAFGGVLLADAVGAFALTFEALAPDRLRGGRGDPARARPRPRDLRPPAMATDRTAAARARPTAGSSPASRLRLGERLGVDPLLVRARRSSSRRSPAASASRSTSSRGSLLPADERGAPRRAPGAARSRSAPARACSCSPALLDAARHRPVVLRRRSTWPVVLLAAGGALIWRTSQSRAARAPPTRPRRQAARPAAAPAEPRPSRSASAPGWAATNVSAHRRSASRSSFAAAFVFLRGDGRSSAPRSTSLLVALVVAVALGGDLRAVDRAARRARSTAERAERIRSQERAEVAAHLHDSVLQTLALVQKRADDPAQVAALARGQERELRAWLIGPARRRRRRRAACAPRSRPRRARSSRRTARRSTSSRSATASSTSAARRSSRPRARRCSTPRAHGGGAGLGLRRGVRRRAPTVFVRDRGPGFDPDAVPADRRGISESIVGRMAPPRRPRRACTPRPARAPRWS